MIYRMLAQDLVRFIIIYGIFILAFSQVMYSKSITKQERKCKGNKSASLQYLWQAFFVLFLSLDGEGQFFGNPMRTALDSIMQSFIMSLGIFGNQWELVADSTDHPYIGQVRWYLCLRKFWTRHSEPLFRSLSSSISSSSSSWPTSSCSTCSSPWWATPTPGSRR